MEDNARHLSGRIEKLSKTLDRTKKEIVSALKSKVCDPRAQDKINTMGTESTFAIAPWPRYALGSQFFDVFRKPRGFTVRFGYVVYPIKINGSDPFKRETVVGYPLFVVLCCW